MIPKQVVRDHESVCVLVVVTEVRFAIKDHGPLNQRVRFHKLVDPRDV